MSKRRRYDFDTTTDDESNESNGYSAKNEKTDLVPWIDFFSKAKKETANTVIVSDSDNSSGSETLGSSDSDTSETSDTSSSDSDFETPKKKRKLTDSHPKSSGIYQGRRILDYDELDVVTKEAKSAEKQSILQRKENNIHLSSITSSASSSNEIVLDVYKAKDQKIVIHSQLAERLKPHQIDGIRHMYECCYGSVDKFVSGPGKGSGCILAHCMGLGKTLQTIALLHTVINYPELKTNRILILCPKSTLSNWKDEISKWIGLIRKTRRLKVFDFSDSMSKHKQLDKLNAWNRFNRHSDNAACFLMSYESFRSLVFNGQQTSKKKLTYVSKKPALALRVRETVQRTLLNRTHLVICDEGHTLKNIESATNRAVTKIKTRRRIVLTGTPMQNNLMEYYAMVNFVKPSFLGTPKEFRNIYANPIQRGQHKDSTPEQTRMMRIQSFNLNRELESFVHRREVSAMMKELPKKFEYVLYVPMSELQSNLYQYYLLANPYTKNSKQLLADYSALRNIWSHPKALKILHAKAVKENDKIPSETIQPFNHREFGETLNTSVNHDWWRSFLTHDDELDSILHSPKYELMFEILKEAQRRSEKCLIFSLSLVSLNIIEHFLKKRLLWKPERDYYRIDGSTKSVQRHKMIVNFNKPQSNAKLFLISSKAGGQGINLVSANRIILLDTSWNPSTDQQSIFRIFRFGQQKNCYIYRLLAMGTMEEKIYSRSVTKQAMSYRVVDKQQIDRKFSMAELSELYTFTKPNLDEREPPIPPNDEILCRLLNKFPDKIFKYHKHESLLDNKQEEEITEEEKQEAMIIHEKIKRKSETVTSSASLGGTMSSIDPSDNQSLSWINVNSNSNENSSTAYQNVLANTKFYDGVNLPTQFAKRKISELEGWAKRAKFSE